MTKKLLPSSILAYLAYRESNGFRPAGAGTITARLGEYRPTVNRHLATLVSDGAILREGAGPATGYKIAGQRGPSAAHSQ